MSTAPLQAIEALQVIEVRQTPVWPSRQSPHAYGYRSPPDRPPAGRAPFAGPRSPRPYCRESSWRDAAPAWLRRGKARIRGQGRGAQATKIRSTSRVYAATWTGPAVGRRCAHSGCANAAQRSAPALGEEARAGLRGGRSERPPAATHDANANKPPMQTTAITIRPLIMVKVSSSILIMRHLLETQPVTNRIVAAGV